MSEKKLGIAARAVGADLSGLGLDPGARARVGAQLARAVLEEQAAGSLGSGKITILGPDLGGIAGIPIEWVGFLEIDRGHLQRLNLEIG